MALVYSAGYRVSNCTMSDACCTSAAPSQRPVVSPDPVDRAFCQPRDVRAWSWWRASGRAPPRWRPTPPTSSAIRRTTPSASARIAARRRLGLARGAAERRGDVGVRHRGPCVRRLACLAWRAARADHDGRGGRARAGRELQRRRAALPLPRRRRQHALGVAVHAQRRDRQHRGAGGRRRACSAPARCGPTSRSPRCSRCSACPRAGS